jgi:hypothetical protein
MENRDHLSVGFATDDACRKCGGAIWWGSVQFAGKPKPSWIAYSEAGHGGGGDMVMEKHDCTKSMHREPPQRLAGRPMPFCVLDRR